MQKAFFRLPETIFSYINMFLICFKCYALSFSFFQFLHPFVSAYNKKEGFKRACNSKILFFYCMINGNQRILKNICCIRFASLVLKDHDLDPVKKLCI